ncbi:DUF664 domain-containing protein [Nonomuraea sp. MTCD27]|uniref:mycothiol transferase n=1 Tax=Nonomuraea sp. MTCD27 TaxID=1676747 RepID=UPI0035BF52D9
MVGRSALSLLGLVRHAAESERFWFRRVMAGQEPSPLFSSPTAPGGAFEVAGADARMVARAWQAWQAWRARDITAMRTCCGSRSMER